MNASDTKIVELQAGDALVIVDVQNDFLPGGNVPVPDGNSVINPLNTYIDSFRSRDLPVFATRDWHPEGHCSFKQQGGVWPPHCIAGTHGAEFSPDLNLTPATIIVSKADTVEKDAYSGFEGTDLDQQLHQQGIKRLFIGGLATDYCVLNTVRDALANQYVVYLLTDAIGAVNVKPGDGDSAEREMEQQGAIPITLQQLA
jgi:nicotinamidase-related amidase